MFASKRELDELTESIKKDVMEQQKEICGKALIKIFNEADTKYIDDFLLLEKKTAIGRIKDICIMKVQMANQEHIQESVEKYVGEEKFIDKIIERIKKKQLI